MNSNDTSRLITQDFVRVGGRYQWWTKQRPEDTYLPLERLCQHRRTDTYLPPGGSFPCNGRNGRV